MSELRRSLALALLAGGCKPEPNSTRELDAPELAPVELEPCIALDVHTDPIWDGWLSHDDEARQGPDAERIGDDCLLMDLQFMDAPLYRVRESIGVGGRLIPVLPGVQSEFDSTAGTTVEAGELVLGSQIVAGYRCIYAVSDRGTLAAGFVSAEHLERVADPAPEPIEQLLGSWADQGWDASGGTDCVPDRFNIARDPAGGFVLEGEASWCCGCDAYGTHVGGVAGRVEFCDGEGVVRDECQMAFAQRGPFLMVADNGQCGGMNVRFLGIYLRSQPINAEPRE